MIYFTESELFRRSNEFLWDYFFKRQYEIEGEPVVVVSVQHYASGLMIVYRWKGERYVSTVSEFLDKISGETSSRLRLIKRRSLLSDQIIMDF